MNADQPPPEQPEASATPLTDAQRSLMQAYDGTLTDVVPTSFSRKLERQLAAVRCELESARADNDKLRSALLRVAGSLGLILKGAGASGPGHSANYDYAKKVISETFNDDEK